MVTCCIPAGEAAQTSISGIVIDPDDPRIVTVCGGRGIMRYGYVWRSTDSGATWARAVDIPAEWAKLVMTKDDGGGNRAMYAAGWNGRGGLLVRSIDRGASWTTLSPPWGAGQWGISVTTSPLDPKRVYVLAGRDRKVFASADNGETWRDMTGDLRQDDFEWNQLWYDWDLACGSSAGATTTPHDILFLGLKHLNFWDSANRTWIGLPDGHDDTHGITVDPDDPNRFFLCNDGGVYEYTHIAGGWSLTSWNATLGVTEVYRGHASPIDARICLAATQDNAVSSSQADPTAWGQLFPPAGGDAIAAYVSPVDVNVQFIEGGVAFHGIGRTGDRWTSNADITPATGGDVLDAFALPIAMDAGGSRLYHGTDFLWIRDEATGAWAGRVGAQKLAGDGSGVRCLGIAPSNRERVYTGSTDGQVWMGTGPQWTWTRIDAGLPVRYVGAISVHPANQDDILVGLAGTGNSHLWRCRNTAASPRVWEDVSGTGNDALPDVPAVGVVRDPRDPSDMYWAGTDVGVFLTRDGGNHWVDYTIPHGLPAAELSDLQLVGRGLFASLFGRGVWRLRLPLTQTTAASASIDDRLFVAATTIDGRIVLCQAQFGHAFSDWFTIAGNGRTDAPVALASIEKTLFVFAKGLDGRIYVNQAELTAANSDIETFASSFSGWFELQGGGVTDAAPAATRVRNSVFVFIKGLDGKIYLNQAEYRHAFSGWFELQGAAARTRLPPARRSRTSCPAS